VSILFGHPTGNPNSHQAALAYFESGQLEAFCVPWMPAPSELSLLRRVPGLSRWATRLERRLFAPLQSAPLVQGHVGEWTRLFKRAVFGEYISPEALAYEANDWLMRTMARECSRSSVTAVHSYEDCSLWQFQKAKQLGKACIYDMPIGYYPAWERIQRELERKFSDWLPAGGFPSSRFVRPDQKRLEMELADLVLVPSRFVEETIHQFCDKRTVLTPYGIDTDYWNARSRSSDGLLTFFYAGPVSVRKGIPLLFEAWRRSGLRKVKLRVAGSWQLSDSKRRDLPPDCEYVGPLSRDQLREEYRRAEVLVLPTFFEGCALVGGEALACGLPLLTTSASGLTELVDLTCARVFSPGDVDCLVDLLRWFAANRDQLPRMSAAARAKAGERNWDSYRKKVCEAVRTLNSGRRSGNDRID